MDIEALPTTYKGISFRSRLEARWAMFWDALEVEYQYEPKKFDFGEMRYIPDFWLPGREKWVEIKGQGPIPIEIRKAQLLAQQTHQDVVILSGLFQFQTFVCNYCLGHHYVELPSGVGITYFWADRGDPRLISMQIDEFMYVFLGYPSEPEDLHRALVPIHMAFRKALVHLYTDVHNATRKTFQKILDGLRKTPEESIE